MPIVGAMQMVSSLNVILKRYCRLITNNFLSDEGFTLSELLVSSTISIIVIASGYALSMVAINANSTDKARIALNNKIDNSLNYLLDEIQSGRSLIKDKSKLPDSCKNFEGNHFVLGVYLPKQAIKRGDYSNTVNSWQSVNCPIIYSLKQEIQKKTGQPITYKLLRKGPSIDKKGFYTSANPSTTVITDSIDKSPMDDLLCSPKWDKKIIKGLIICFDPDLKSAEIAISARNTITPVRNVVNRQTSGSFSRIFEREIMGNIPVEGGGSQCNTGCSCNYYGTQIRSDRVNFTIDTSGSMGWYRINGKSLMEHAKTETIRLIECLKDGTKLSINGFDHRQNYCFKRPITINSYWKNKAINCVSKMYAYGGTNPWSGLNKDIQDQDVGQIIILSDGQTYPPPYGRCFYDGRVGWHADCYARYNEQVRDNTPGGKVTFDTISLWNNFCGTQDYQWLGRLAAKNDGECSLIK